MNDILEVMIPSETVRKYVLESGWTFTDKEKAALLHMRYCRLPCQELYSYLRDLRDETAAVAGGKCVSGGFMLLLYILILTY